jgi:WD40 repeat protein
VLPRRHVASIEFDRSGKRLVVAVGNTARVVDIGGSASAPPFRAPAPPWLESVNFSHDGTLIVAGSHEGAVVWRLDRRSPPKLLPESDVLSAEASRNGEFVVTSGPEGASVWKWESRKRLTRLPDQLKVRDAGFSPDGTLVVAGSGDGFAQVADWRRRDRVLAFGDTQGPPVTSAAFSPDGTKILLTLGPAGAIVLDCPGCGSPAALERRAGG